MATNWLLKLNNFFSFLFQHKALREEEGDFPVRYSEVRKFKVNGMQYGWALYKINCI